MESTIVHQMLDADDVARLRSSFAALIPRSDEAAARFYEELFRQAPQVRVLFTTEPFEHGQRFMMMLASIMDWLNDPEKLVAELRALGKRHVGYGAKPEHFEVVGRSLIYALEQMLKEKFSPEIRASWVKLYRLISDCMLEEF